MHVVLQTDASPPRKIDSRFHSYHRSGGKRLIGSGSQPGSFVHFQAQAVPQAVFCAAECTAAELVSIKQELERLRENLVRSSG